MSDKISIGIVGRILVFVLAYSLIGVALPTQQGSVTITYYIGALLTGFLYALLLGFVLTRMTIGRKGRIVSVWVLIFVIQFFNPLLEGYFFTNLLSDTAILAGGALFGVILAFAYAVIAGLLFTPKQETNSIASELRSYLGGRNVSSWIWRAVVASLSWVLFYFIFGAIVAPIVTPYYTDPNLGYNLVLPGIDTILFVQALRGFIYVGALLPLVAFLKVGLKWLTLVVLGFMYIGGGLAIFIIVETFPLVLRIVHGFGE